MAVAVFDAYKDWVRRNRQWLSSAESMANTLTWLLPDRLAESELAPEALSTLIGVISVINDHIIETAPTEAPSQASNRSLRPASQPSSFPLHNQRALQSPNRNLALFQPNGFSPNLPPNQAPNLHAPNLNLPAPYPLSHNGSPEFGGMGMVPWALVLAVVKEGEVLGEMAAEQWLGEDGKWTAVAGIEALKAAIRLLLLHRDRWRLLFGGGSTENPGPSKPSPTPSTSSSLQAQQPSPYQQQQPHSTGGSMGYSVGNHRGMNGQQAATTRALGAFQRFQRQNSQKIPAIHMELSAHDPQLFTPLSSIPVSMSPLPPSLPSCMHVTAELIHIFRPLLYVLAIRAAARAARSRAGAPAAAAAAAAADADPSQPAAAAAAAAAATAADARRTEGSAAQKEVFQLTDEERADLARRRMLLVMYLLRSPCFDAVTRHPLEGIRSFVRPIPLLGSLAERGFEMLLGIQSTRNDRKGPPENAEEGITQERLVQARLASLAAAEPLAAALRETLSEASGVREAVRQEGAVQAELGEVVSEVARFQEQHRKWATAFNELHTAIKEIGDFENWMKVMERDIALVTTTIKIVTSSPSKT
ncbi:unnamed protein product [Closterium sp. Yama58-4]|nr:unnamed protein product [Closterium sp. Yama58-4]